MHICLLMKYIFVFPKHIFVFQKTNVCFEVWNVSFNEMCLFQKTHFKIGPSDVNFYYFFDIDNLFLDSWGEIERTQHVRNFLTVHQS